MTQTVGQGKASETPSAGWSSSCWRLSWQLCPFDQWFPFPSTRLAAVPLASYHDPWLTSSYLIASDSQLIPQISKWWPGPVEQEKRESPQCNQDQLRYFQGLVQNENVGSLFKRQEKVPLKTLKYSVFLSLRSSSVQTHACYSIRPHLTDSRSKIKELRISRQEWRAWMIPKGLRLGPVQPQGPQAHESGSEPKATLSV